MLPVHHIHSFNLELDEMKQIQKQLREQIQIMPFREVPQYVAGVDLAYAEPWAFAVIIVMEHTSKTIVEIVHHQEKVSFEYIPGFLAFRELPVFLKAWEKLKTEPDLVFFDGNGMLHPERVGIATHASFFIGKPTIGVAKNPFIGEFEDPEIEKGSYSPIYDAEEVIGAVLRTQTKVKPIYVSVGNRIDLPSAITMTMHYVGKESRIPEIIRQADHETRKLRKKWQEHL